MHDGLIEQADTPANVFRFPANKFVAGFIGAPPMNFFAGSFADDAAITIAGLDQPIPVDRATFALPPAGAPVTLGLRPEYIVPQDHGLTPRAPIDFDADVMLSEALGNETLITASIGPTEFVTRVLYPSDVMDGERMRFSIDTARIHLFDAEAERTLRRTEQT